MIRFRLIISLQQTLNMNFFMPRSSYGTIIAPSIYEAAPPSSWMGASYNAVPGLYEEEQLSSIWTSEPYFNRSNEVTRPYMGVAGSSNNVQEIFGTDASTEANTFNPLGVFKETQENPEASTSAVDPEIVSPPEPTPTVEPVVESSVENAVEVEEGAAAAETSFSEAAPVAIAASVLSSAIHAATTGVANNELSTAESNLISSVNSGAHGSFTGQQAWLNYNQAKFSSQISSNTTVSSIAELTLGPVGALGAGIYSLIGSQASSYDGFQIQGNSGNMVNPATAASSTSDLNQ